MSDIRIYSKDQAEALTPVTGDVILCSEAGFNNASTEANSVHLATTGGANPVWKSFNPDTD